VNKKINDLISKYEKKEAGRELSLIGFVVQNFREIDFSQDFKKAVLSCLDFSAENFDEINFSKAKLNKTNFSKTSFTFCSFFRANFSGSNLKAANLSGSDLSYANFDNCDLREADLSYCILRGVSVKNTKFGGCYGISSKLQAWLESKGAIFDSSYAPPKATNNRKKEGTTISQTFKRNFGTPQYDVLNDVGPYCRELIRLVENDEARAKSLLSMVFWESFLNSKAIDDYFKRACEGVEIFDKTKATTQIVAFGKERRSGYGLSIYSGQYTKPFPYAVKGVDIVDEDLLRGWKKASENWSESSFINKVKDIGGLAACELYRKHDFPMLISKETVSELNASFIDKEACKSLSGKKILHGISPLNSSEPDRSIGVFCSRDKECLVTTALHSSKEGSDFAKVGDEVKVYIEGDIFKGRVSGTHSVSDSCLISVDPGESEEIRGKCCEGNAAPLDKNIPPLNEDVHFYSCSRGRLITTKLKGVSANFLSQIFSPDSFRHVQVCIQTLPHSKSGDSGSAIFDDEGNLFGFCFYKTEAFEAHTAWVWANSVFHVHNVK